MTGLDSTVSQIHVEGSQICCRNTNSCFYINISRNKATYTDVCLSFTKQTKILILNLHDSHLFQFFSATFCTRKETIMYSYCIYTSILTLYTLLLNTESPASAVQMITLTVCSTTMGMSGVRHIELWWMDLLCFNVKELIRNTR